MKGRGSLAGLSLFLLFLLVSLLTGFEPGADIGRNFLSFAGSMLSILPGAFILIGLFQVWVSREAVERHLGEGGSFTGYLWMILLAGTTVGGLYVAFPVAAALYGKGARLQLVLSYLGFAAVCRIPMAVFEASFLGIRFTAVRILVTIPLVIFSSLLLSRYLTRRGWRMETREERGLRE